MLHWSIVFLSLYSTVMAGPTVGPRQALAPAMKQTVGTWNLKGCFKDIGERLLSFRFDVPGGNSAEGCTALCASKGYGLAGMEYGSECWCDNYLPYGQLAPDSDCSFVCPADSTELCGAGNRLVIYENPAATPPSTQACIDWRDSWSFSGHLLHAVPQIEGSGPITQLYPTPVTPLNDPFGTPNQWSVISEQIFGDYVDIGVVDGILRSYNHLVLPPIVGESQAFVDKWGVYPPAPGSYNHYCAMPNPQGPSRFIGYPVLGVNKANNVWGLCANTTANGRRDLIYQPVANHPHYVKTDCQSVYVRMDPHYGTGN